MGPSQDNNLIVCRSTGKLYSIHPQSCFQLYYFKCHLNSFTSVCLNQWKVSVMGTIFTMVFCLPLPQYRLDTRCSSITVEHARPLHLTESFYSRVLHAVLCQVTVPSGGFTKKGGSKLCSQIYIQGLIFFSSSLQN